MAALVVIRREFYVSGSGRITWVVEVVICSSSCKVHKDNQITISLLTLQSKV